VTVQVYLGKDRATGRRRYQVETMRGTDDDARFRIAEIVRDAGRGSLLDSPNLTVADYLEDWLRTHGSRRLRPRTLAGYQDHVRRYMIPRIGHLRLSRLAPRHVIDMETDLLRRGGRGGAPLSARTVLQTHRILSSALSQAMRSELINRNVASLVEPPRVSRHEFPTLTFQQVRQFLDGIGNPLHRSIVLLAVQTGLRRSEILGLQWRDLDIDKGMISVRRSLIQMPGGEVTVADTKSGYGRLVPMVEETRILLGSLRESALESAQESAQNSGLELGGDGVLDDHSFVFCHPDGRPLTPHSVTQAFRRARARAGLKGFRLHDLRHTHATLLLAEGVHLKVVSERLGHSSISITGDLYSHILPSVQIEAVQRFGSAWNAGESSPAADPVAPASPEPGGAAGDVLESGEIAPESGEDAPSGEIALESGEDAPSGEIALESGEDAGESGEVAGEPGPGARNGPESRGVAGDIVERNGVAGSMDEAPEDGFAVKKLSKTDGEAV
jgi:integrase